MPIILVGLNHTTAPVELREQFSLRGCGLTFALAELPVHAAVFNGDPIYDDVPHSLPTLSEGVILSTCNRLEVYAVTREMTAGQAAVEVFLSRLQGSALATLKPYLYFMHDQEAVTHLMRVAAGLDSQILGEPQILGQVAQALTSAQSASASGPILAHLFTTAIRAGKRTRSETGISRHTTSVSHTAALLAEEQLGGLDAVRVLVIGAGEMAELAAQALQQRGASHILCANRTYSSAQTLATKIEGEAIAWHNLTEALIHADMVISATGAPHMVVHVDDLSPVLPARDGRPLLLIDIAVPRDIQEEVGQLPGITLVDIDDLKTVVDENRAQREAAIPHVETIVAEEASAFASWINGLQIVPVIADLRAYADHIMQAEVERALSTLKDAGPEERKVIELLAHRLVNKLLHAPTVALREQASHGNGYAYAHMTRELFDLSESQYQPNHARKNSNGHRPITQEAQQESRHD